MVTVSTDAGIRLARAKVAADLADADEEISSARMTAVRLEFGMAAMAVADELIEQGFGAVESWEEPCGPRK